MFKFHSSSPLRSGWTKDRIETMTAHLVCPSNPAPAGAGRRSWRRQCAPQNHKEQGRQTLQHLRTLLLNIKWTGATLFVQKLWNHNKLEDLHLRLAAHRLLPLASKGFLQFRFCIRITAIWTLNHTCKNAVMYVWGRVHVHVHHLCSHDFSRYSSILYMRFQELRGIKGPSRRWQLKLSLIEENPVADVTLNTYELFLCTNSPVVGVFETLSGVMLWKCREDWWIDSWPPFVYSTSPLNKTWTDSCTFRLEVLHFYHWLSPDMNPKLCIISSFLHCSHRDFTFTATCCTNYDEWMVCPL